MKIALQKFFDLTTDPIIMLLLPTTNYQQQFCPLLLDGVNNWNYANDILLRHGKVPCRYPER